MIDMVSKHIAPFLEFQRSKNKITSLKCRCFIKTNPFQLEGHQLCSYDPLPYRKATSFILLIMLPISTTAEYIIKKLQNATSYHENS